ncbi:hypothetical protein CIT31_19575 [Mesorhizobium wenxiniae]|uniref:Uncharacterized protein n=1 Tax=Mesorhizobium wenxiniae TaxID=2014805 RepID=A0A271KDZ6_9HYPH|nr:hypothetical protein CIT31_19575 [Mesorhizobium wenxiniae]
MISPVKGEMSPKATEGVGSTGLAFLQRMEVGARRAATPSGLPAISPSRDPQGGRLQLHAGAP